MARSHFHRLKQPQPPSVTVSSYIVSFIIRVVDSPDPHKKTVTSSWGASLQSACLLSASFLGYISRALEEPTSPRWLRPLADAVWRLCGGDSQLRKQTAPRCPYLRKHLRRFLMPFILITSEWRASRRSHLEMKLGPRDGKYCWRCQMVVNNVAVTPPLIRLLRPDHFLEMFLHIHSPLTFWWNPLKIFPLQRVTFHFQLLSATATGCCMGWGQGSRVRVWFRVWLSVKVGLINAFNVSVCNSLIFVFSFLLLFFCFYIVTAQQQHSHSILLVNW